MNSIRDFWETVVLRDVLGYIVPGAVTLLAVGLLMLALILMPLAPRARHFVVAGVLHPLFVSHKPWVCSYPWLAAAIVIPLCFVIGHVQGELVAFLGKHCVGWWNLGALALDFLTGDAKRGGDYANAALRELAGIDGAGDLVAVCAEQPGRFRELCCYLTQVGSNTERDDCLREAKQQARDLWYLCNHYVLNESPGLHAMWIGRYYVLAILFSNLFLSFVFLTVSLVPLLFWLWLAVVNTSLNAGPFGCHSVAILLPLKFLLAVGVTFATCWLAISSTLCCSWEFHRAYVERTFPIFYVVSRARGRKRRDNES
jgi:hypothetical protein